MVADNDETAPWSRQQILRAPCFVNGTPFDSVALAAIEYEWDLDDVVNSLYLGGTAFGEEMISLQDEEEEYDRQALASERWKKVRGGFAKLPSPSEEVVESWIGLPMHKRVIPKEKAE